MNIVNEAKEICKNGDLSHDYVFNLAERVQMAESKSRRLREELEYEQKRFGLLRDKENINDTRIMELRDRERKLIAALKTIHEETSDPGARECARELLGDIGAI